MCPFSFYLRCGSRGTPPCFSLSRSLSSFHSGSCQHLCLFVERGLFLRLGSLFFICSHIPLSRHSVKIIVLNSIFLYYFPATTYVVVVRQTEETVVSGTPSVVEIPAAETTVDFSELITNVQLTPTTIAVEIAGTYGGDENSVVFTMKVNGADEPQTLSAESVLTTEWIYPGTTLSLSFSSRQTAFRFTGAVSTEITLLSQHTHITVDGVETGIDLPGLTTTIVATDSTVVLVELPETTTTVEITAETYSLTVMAYKISTGGDGQDSGSSYCGTQVLAAGDENTPCVMSLTTTITLPSEAATSNLYLYAPGLTTSFMLPGITTTFLQGIGGSLRQ